MENLLVADLVYNLSVNSNGWHNFKFYLDIRTGTLIRIIDIYNQSISKTYIRSFYHMGYKIKLNEDLYMFGLFTSTPITILGEYTIHNIQLTNSVFKYINNPIFVRNSILCQYLEVIDNLQNFPKYIKEEVSNHKSIKLGLEILAKDAENGFIKSLYACDFNSGISLISALEEYLNGEKTKIIINRGKYNKDFNFLKENGLRNEDIMELVDRIILKKENYLNDKIFSTKHIKY